MPVPAPLEQFLTVRRSVLLPVISLSAMYLVYGLNIALFTIYIHLFRHRRNTGKTAYLPAIVILFALSTLVVVSQSIFRGLNVVLAFEAVKNDDYTSLRQFLRHDIRKTLAFGLSDLCPPLLNAAADYILIHRCYVIWGSRKRFAIPLVGASVITNVIGLVGAFLYTMGIRDIRMEENQRLLDTGKHLETVFMIMSVIVNMVLTIMTAGRIWWLYRGARKYSSSSKRLFKWAAKIVVESGILYPTFTLIQLIWTNTNALNAIPMEFSGVSYQIAALAPTLIMVRAQLGRTVESTMNSPEVVSDIHFTDGPLPSQGHSYDTSVTHVQTHSISLNMRLTQEERSGSHKDGGTV
ncbi:hypothetical protein Moror_7469 [Moniliophthora roreri MCA 2997]|uniref:Integral membrane protein n=1 Tax=Moniliophthora roreri (strain MCA 2997) TaxID=1381753 RepID=V2XQE0_MONRO|nr:hypothetical protein Moror_7469 [Moniliophthora roreri MCA 2997]